MDNHANTYVAGSNCIILQYTGKECDVSSYRDDYDSIQNVPIVHAATAWQSIETGQTYILVLNESIWMGDTMSHTLINPNQLRHFGTKVQDNPMSNEPINHCLLSLKIRNFAWNYQWLEQYVILIHLLHLKRNCKHVHILHYLHHIHGKGTT